MYQAYDPEQGDFVWLREAFDFRPKRDRVRVAKKVYKYFDDVKIWHEYWIDGARDYVLTESGFGQFFQDFDAVASKHSYLRNFLSKFDICLRPVIEPLYLHHSRRGGNYFSILFQALQRKIADDPEIYRICFPNDPTFKFTITHTELAEEIAAQQRFDDDPTMIPDRKARLVLAHFALTEIEILLVSAFTEAVKELDQ